MVFSDFESNYVVNTLACELRPFKIIRLNKNGGLRDSNNKVSL